MCIQVSIYKTYTLVYYYILFPLYIFSSNIDLIHICIENVIKYSFNWKEKSGEGKKKRESWRGITGPDPVSFRRTHAMRHERKEKGACSPSVSASVRTMSFFWDTRADISRTRIHTFLPCVFVPCWMRRLFVAVSRLFEVLVRTMEAD